MTQITREANESKVAPAALNLYCIEHEEMVRVGYEEDGAICHAAHTGEDFTYCFFSMGYAFCPPPVEYPYDIPHDWAAQDLSGEEKEQAERAEEGFWLGGGE